MIDSHVGERITRDGSKIDSIYQHAADTPAAARRDGEGLAGSIGKQHGSGRTQRPTRAHRSRDGNARDQAEVDIGNRQAVHGHRLI